MTRAQLVALTAIAAVVLGGTVAYGLLRLYA
jgi:ribose/xylose/arabinose/galactoside ABC-type transport system permease subunit